MYTLRVGIRNNKSIDDFRLIFGKTMMKGVLARLERIFERVDAKEDISTDVKLLKLHCVDIVKHETRGKHLEKKRREYGTRNLRIFANAISQASFGKMWESVYTCEVI